MGDAETDDEISIGKYAVSSISYNNFKSLTSDNNLLKSK